MRHLADGTLRRMVDEPLAVSAREREHYTACQRCQSRFGEIGANARETALLLSMPVAPADPSLALAQIRQRIASEHLEPLRRWQTWLRPASRRVPRWNDYRPSRALGGAAVIVALVCALLFTPARSLAQSFIDVFQPKHVAPVAVTPADLASLPDLSRFGTLKVPRKLPDQPVANAAAAAAATHMKVLTPASLPADVPAGVTYDVLPGSTASFTFRAARARRTALAQGKPLPTMPAGLDGSTLQVRTGAAVIAVYGSGKGEAIPPLVIGQMMAPTISTTRVSVKTMEDYVLRLPGVTPRLANAIRSIGDPTKTLPLPIPADRAQAQTVQVQGVRGTAVGDATGVGSAVVWVKSGIIYGVGGAQSEDQIIAIANSLH